MQILGIFAWRKHLKKESFEIKKTSLDEKNKIILAVVMPLLIVVAAIMLKIFADASPYMDAFALIFSILGQYLTLKRCIEQWYIWFLVNLVTLIMGIQAYINGSDTLALVFMWFIYLLLAIYFLYCWKKELKQNNY